jgi:hypothetical protein
MAARRNNQRFALLVQGRHLPGDSSGEARYEYLDCYFSFRRTIGGDLCAGWGSLNTFEPLTIGTSYTYSTGG